MEVEMGPALSSPALPDHLSISLPGISRLPRVQPSLSGVRPPPGFTGTPMGSGGFSGSGETPAIRQAPPLHFGGTRSLPNRTTATITSCTAPAVTMDSLDSVISLQQLRSDVMARYPGYQVETSEPAPTKPISLGLANFQQAKPEKEANLPLSTSLEAWLTCQAQTLEGKDQHGRVIKPL